MKKNLARQAMSGKASRQRKKQTHKKIIRPFDEPKISLLENKEWMDFIASIDRNQSVYLTVANFGYLTLVLNLYHSLQKVTDDRSMFVVLTPDKRLYNALKSWPCIRVFLVNYKPWCGNNHVSSGAVSFKQNDWNAITRFKLLATWIILKSNRSVFYIDPDVVFVQDPGPHIKSLKKDSVYIQRGNDYCTGVILAHPGKLADHLFDPIKWRRCNQDDETYMKTTIRFLISNEKIVQSLVKTFDFDLFPNGLLWKNDKDEGIQKAKQSIDSKECILFHFNHISGLPAKIETMKVTGSFTQIMKIIRVPNKFKILLNNICIDRNGTNYPPHHTGNHLEEACEGMVKDISRKRLIASAYTYLPVHWTAIAVSKNVYLLAELKAWCDQLFATHKKEKFWSVVQHCKGLYGSCGIIVPQSTKLFMTSDPNGAIALNFEIKQRRVPIRKTEITKDKAAAMIKATKTQHKGTIHRQPTAMEIYRIARHNEARRNQGCKDKKRVSIKIPRKKPRRVRQIAATTRKLHQYLPSVLPEQGWITVPLVSNKSNSNNNYKSNNKRCYLASFIGNIDVHPIRKKMQQVFAAVDKTIVKNGAYKDKGDVNEFEKLMTNSVFALCPRGFGTTSFRITEAMEYGCIPVYISDKLSLPFHEKINMADVCVLVKSDDIDALPDLLKNMSQSAIQILRDNIERFRERFFTMEGCCRTILCDYIDEE